MGAFFTSWQTWEMMTFVLACAIVFVFAFGLARLWYTNRKIERLELVDEERRQRLAEMRHCGFDPRGVNDIPFGVRAIESGIEVEGIWISRTNTPAASKRGSTLTLNMDGSESPKGKGKEVDTSYESYRRGPPVSSMSSSSPEQPLMYSHSGRGRPAKYPTRVSTDELDPLTQMRTSYSRPTSMVSGTTDSYFDLSRATHPVDVLPEATWEPQAPYYDYSSSDADVSGQGKKLQKKARQ